MTGPDWGHARWRINGRGYRGPDFAPVALAQYRMNLETFVDVARNAGATPILSTQARLAAPDNGPAARARILYDFQPFTHEALCAAFDWTDRIARDVSRRNGTPLLEAAPLSGQDPFFKDHVHLAAAGSEALARTAAAAILRALAEPAPPPEQAE